MHIFIKECHLLTTINGVSKENSKHLYLESESYKIKAEFSASNWEQCGILHQHTLCWLEKEERESEEPE